MDFEKIEKRAYRLLQDYFIDQPAVNVKSLAKDEGFLIAEENLNSEISGFLIIENGKKVIGIDNQAVETRNRFTIAHEMGHFYLHHVDSGTHVDKRIVYNRSKYSGRQETEANVFAAAILMPGFLLTRVVNNRYGGFLDDSDIEDLAEEFCVSQIAMSFRLKNLNIV